MLGTPFALAAAASLVLTGGAAPPRQDALVLSPGQVAEFEELFTSYLVPEDAWDGLLEAVATGEPVDAQTDAAPASTEPFVLGDLEGTISRWDDGSFAASLAEVGVFLASGAVVPLAVTGCARFSSAGGVSSTNCTVQETVFNLTLQFQANYWQSAQQAQITRAWNHNAFYLGGSWTFEHLIVTKTTGFSNSQPATAELVVMATFLGSNSRAWLQLSVGPTSVTTQKNY